MPKQTLTINKFDGGLNTFSDSRDINDNEFFQAWNAVFDRAGVIRMAGEGHKYIQGLPHSQTHSSGYMQPGFGLFSFGSDANLMSHNMYTDLNMGIESGTVAGAASNSLTVTLATTPSTTPIAQYQTANYFTNRTIMFYDGSGKGSYIIGTRYIEGYAYNSDPVSYTVTLNSKITVTSTTKYKIFGWTASGGFGISPWSIPEYYTASSEAPNGTFNAESAVGSNIITISSHGYEHFDEVLYKNGGTAVGGLVDGGVYAVYKIDANTIRLYKNKELLAADILASSTSNCLTLSDGGNENHYLRHWPQTDIDFNQNNFFTFGESGYNTPVIAAEAMDVDETALTITTGGVNLLGLATDNSGNNGATLYIKLIHLSDSEAANSEIMGVSSISGDTLTITRGQLDTTAYAHSNGAELIVLRYPEQNHNNISANTGVFNIIKNRGKYLGRLTFNRGPTVGGGQGTLPVELLNNTTDFSSNWTETGDFALTSAGAKYTHSTGEATLTQAHGSRAATGSVKTLYKFSYEISGLLTDVDRDQGVETFKILGTTGGSSTLAARDVHLPLSSGYHEVYFYSQATTASANFTIFVSSQTTGTFTIRKASIRAVDSSTLTFIPGKEYHLSFDLSYSRPYMNSVSDVRVGVGTTELNESYSDRLPYVLLYNDTISNTSGTSTGLYLQAFNDNPTWVEGQGFKFNFLESNPESMNLIANGDFESGITAGGGVNDEDTGWAWVHTLSGSTISLIDGTSEYSFNAKKSLAMYHAGVIQESDGERANYIMQSVTVNSNCCYALSFAYASEVGIDYSIEDRTNSTWLTSGTTTVDLGNKWKTLTNSYDNLHSNELFRYRYPSVNTTDNSSNEGKSPLSYIYFRTPETSDGSDITIRLKFAARSTTFPTYLTNVVLFKAFPDLLTMSKINRAYNDFITLSPAGYRYKMSFVVPENYEESNNWTLAIDGGMYTNPNTQSSPSHTPIGTTGSINPKTKISNNSYSNQTLTIDNIAITSKGHNSSNLDASENIIMLSDNLSTSSNIHAYSSNGSNWVRDVIEWDGLKSRPDFIKVGEVGALRVCDANFDNSNPTALFYYEDNGSDIKRWTTDYEILQPPPKLNAIQSGQSAYIHNKFNARNWIEEYCGDLTYFGDKGSLSTDSNNLADDHKRTNWENDRLGSNGIVMTYLQGTPSLRGHSNGTGTILTREGREYQQFGMGVRDNNVWRPYADNNQRRRNPIQFIIRGKKDAHEVYYDTDTDNGRYNRAKAMQQHCIDTNHVNGIKNKTSTGGGTPITGKADRLQIAKIEGTLTWDAQFARQRSKTAEGWMWNLQHHPYFRAKVAKSRKDPNFTHTETHKQSIVNYGRWTDINGADIEPIGDWAEDEELYQLSSLNAVQNKTWGQSAWWSTGEVMSDSDPDHKYWRRAPKAFPVSIDLTDINDGEGLYSDDDFFFNIETFHQSLSGDTFLNYHIAAYSHLFYCWNESSNDITNNSQWYGDADDGSWSGPLHRDTADGASGVGDVPWYWYENQSDWMKLHDFTRYERMIFNNLMVYFYNASWNPENDGQTASQSGETTVNMNFETSTEIEATGWAHTGFKLAVTTVNQFDEESHLEIAEQEIGVDDSGDRTIPEGSAPEVDIYVGHDITENSKIKKLKYYMKDTNSDIWYLQFWVDLEKDRAYAASSNWEDKPTNVSSHKYKIYNLPTKHMANFNEVDSYESETLVPASVAEKGPVEMACRYKCSVVANDRLYVGNVKFGDKIYGDRMVKSPPHKFNVLPSSSYLDLVVNDGDEITALAYYKDKILQFKKRKVFVLDVSGEYEFIAETFDNVGVKQQSQVANTKYGIVWANPNGCYLYNGKELTNLIENKIPNTQTLSAIQYNFWSIDTEQYPPPCIEYQEKRDSLIITLSSDLSSHSLAIDGFHYHFPTKSWSFIYDRLLGTNLAKSGKISNFVKNQYGDVLYSSFGSSTSDIFKWNDEPSANNANASGSDKLGALYFTTRDFDFGNISARKKIYKVYVTYKTDDGEDSGVSLKAAVNGTGVFDSTFKATSKFAGTSTVCYGSSTLDETDGKWKMAELKFSTPSEVNNIYSLQLQFSEAAGNVPASFEINDLSIVYRIKKVK